MLGKICLPSASVLTLILLCAIGESRGGELGQTTNILSLSAKTDKPKFVLGEPIWVTCSVINDGKDPVRVLLEASRCKGLQFDISARSEARARRKPIPVDLEKMYREIKLPPNEKHEMKVLLNNWLSFEKQGHAVIRCKLLLILLDQIAKKELSTDLEIEILPLNMHALEGIIVKLGKALEQKEPMKRIDASECLAAIDVLELHQKVVPYLARALGDENIQVQYNAIRGLIAINTPVTTELLKDALNLKDEGARRMAFLELKKRGIEVRSWEFYKTR